MTATPLSLYLDLEKGATADLEVVSRAALAWSAAIKELAFILDPSLEVRVEIASGTPGSFSLNSLIKAVRKAQNEPVTFRALAIVLALWLGGKVVDHYTDGWIDKLPGGKAEEVAALSEDQMDQLAEKVVRGLEAKKAKQHVQELYREAERDPVIIGVGVTEKAGERPEVIVPRSEFAFRAGHSQIRTVTVTKRLVPAKMTVTLIKPVLVPGDRKWGLLTPFGELGFKIKDKVFVERVLSGTTSVPMVAGIEMDVETETTEEMQNGVWVPVDRVVTHVSGLRSPPEQGALFSLPPQYNEPPDDDD